MKVMETDVLVVGSGIAGVMAALKAAQQGCRVLLTSKVSIKSGNSIFAGGGWLIPSQEFPPDDYVHFVMESGKQVNDPNLVQVLSQRAAFMIKKLESMGVPLERRGDKYWYVKMGQSSQFPGSVLMRELLKHVKQKQIKTLPWVCIVDLLLKDGRISGAAGVSRKHGLLIIKAKSIVLSTGGAGGLYKRSSNHRKIVGDGYWLALKAGLALRDMEFVQFYPIGLAEPRMPSTIIQPPIPKEAKIFNAKGENLLSKYGLKFNLNEAVMQYRDELTVILSRESQDSKIYMDCTEVPSQKWDKWFLNRLALINQEFRQRPFLIAPAVHFFMGGIEIDQDARTAIPGLFAAGEISAGVHGANRQGGNALTECIVFGDIAGESARRYASGRFHRQTKKYVSATLPHWGTRTTVEKNLFSELQVLTWKHAGPTRNERSLAEGLNKISKLEKKLEKLKAVERSIALNEVAGGLLVSKVIILASLARKESRGAFHRDDFTQRDDANGLSNIFLKFDREMSDLIVFNRPKAI
jgi:succinate dehydrogenase/fumarate reductase flavoprotein subunit